MILQALKDYHNSGKTIKVGLVGAGQMGEGTILQMEKVLAISVTAAAARTPGKCAEIFAAAGVDKSDITETNSERDAAKALEAGLRVASTDFRTIVGQEEIDLIIEATGIPEVGAQVAYEAILSGKHVVQMNIETDATVGYYLSNLARQNRVVYTLTSGDEPGAAMELHDFASAIGLEVICLGKGKNNPLDRRITPEQCEKKARSLRMNPWMLSSFIDGTKTMLEMTCLGNAVGFLPNTRGMTGPKVAPETLSRVFCLEKDGGVLKRKGVVEYGFGVAPGVFAIVEAEHPKIVRDLKYLSLGDGPTYALFRPYHLASLETPIAVARAAIYGQPTLAAEEQPACETIAVAKRKLIAGERIDSLGGYTVYGLIESAAISRQLDLLPLGLAPGCVVTNTLAANQPITYQDIALPDNTIVNLRNLQDKLLATRQSVNSVKEVRALT